MTTTAPSFDDLRGEIEGGKPLRDATIAYFDGGGTGDVYFPAVVDTRFPVPCWPLGTWEQGIELVHEWETLRGRRVHKGSGYYWAAVRDVVLGNLDRGFLYMHSSLDEDRRTTSTSSLPDTPSAKFVTLDAARTDHYFKSQVDRYVAFLTEHLDTYRSSGRGTLAFPDLRARVLSCPKALLDTFFTLVYTVARSINLKGPRLASQIRRTDFGAVFLGGMALDACVVTEHAVRHSPTGGPKAVGIAVAHKKKTPTFVHMALVIAEGAAPSGEVDLTMQDLSTLNGAFQNAYEATMRQVLDGSYALASKRTLSLREKDVAVAYGVRNVMAHGVPNEPVVATRFDEIEQSLFFCIFSALERLYP